MADRYTGRDGRRSQQTEKDNKVIDRMVVGWVLLGVLAFIVTAVVL